MAGQAVADRDPQTVLADLARGFTYRADGALDTWRIHKGPGPVVGDCEDFALALAWRLAGSSWLRFLWHLISCKSVIWHCELIGGVGHAVLWHRGAGWADNVYPAWAGQTRHRRRFPWVMPFPLIKLSLAPVFAWINGTVKRAEGGGAGQ